VAGHLAHHHLLAALQLQPLAVPAHAVCEHAACQCAATQRASEKPHKRRRVHVWGVADM
jgi:hypothetical protein